MPVTGMKSREWKWGILIGGACSVWLVLCWALGLHGGGLGRLQLATGLSVLVSFVGYVLAMGSVFRREPETTFAEGLRFGALIAVVSALVIVLAHFLYLRFLNPGFAEHVAGEYRNHFESAGVKEPDLTAIAEGAKAAFGLRATLIQAGGGAIVQGLIFSAIAAGAMRWRAIR